MSGKIENVSFVSADLKSKLPFGYEVMSIDPNSLIQNGPCVDLNLLPTHTLDLVQRSTGMKAVAYLRVDRRAFDPTKIDHSQGAVMIKTWLEEIFADHLGHEYAPSVNRNDMLPDTPIDQYEKQALEQIARTLSSELLPWAQPAPLSYSVNKEGCQRLYVPLGGNLHFNCADKSNLYLDRIGNIVVDVEIAGQKIKGIFYQEVLTDKLLEITQYKVIEATFQKRMAELMPWFPKVNLTYDYMVTASA